ncbi:MAG: glycosyltransferase [Methylomarinum sp.]|nr:glycosyltransferase [Methylomarinum sp.]
MKILMINTSDINGGAARAAYRLHCALLEAGIDSNMLVQDKISDDYSVIASEATIQKGLAKVRPHLDSLPVQFYKNRTKTLFSTAWLPSFGLVDRINALKPDVVHLHWVNGGMLRIEELVKINVPIVWSLHDMWAFTGGCHYDEHCEGYKQHCGNCKVLVSNKENDLSRRIHSRKSKVFDGIEKLTIIGLSRWMADCAESSQLFGNKKIVNLPNAIDTDIFSPFDKSQSRKLLNLPIDKKLILFGAMGAISDPRKGFLELSASLSLLKRDDVELVVFGSSQPKNSQGFSHKAHYLGHLHDDVTLRVLYNAADVMVVPSLQENLSNAIMESLACGTPVVGFDVGGNNDMVEHKKNGYLAKVGNEQDLANGVEWVLNADNYVGLCANARDKVVSTFDSRLVAKQYVELYKQV